MIRFIARIGSVRVYAVVQASRPGVREIVAVGVIAALAGCSISSPLDPVSQQQTPSFIFGEGTNCEAATFESYRWCYVYFPYWQTVYPGSPCGTMCVATFPLGTLKGGMIRSTATRLLAHGEQMCQLAGAHMISLLDQDLISRRIPWDFDNNGGLIMGTNWHGPIPFSTVAIHIWDAAFGMGQAVVDWLMTHELGHHVLSSFEDEGAADALATLCFGPKPY